LRVCLRRLDKGVRLGPPTPRALPIIALAGALGLVTGVIISAGLGASASHTPPAPSAIELPEPQPAEEISALRRSPVVRAVERVAPAVVSITTAIPAQNPFGWMSPARLESSEGSGVVIAAEGIVLTNAHVVQGASRITASFADGAAYEAHIMGISPDLDLAVLRLRGAEGLKAAPIGTSGDLLLGEPVIAIGNPFGLGHTVTTGVVSTTRRALETDERVYQDFIQTDAGINPGNSGGPLLNIEGQLIGINTAIRPDAENIGFAIPVDRAMKVARDLVDYGSVQLPWLGVDLTDVRVRSPQTGISTAAVVERVHGDEAQSAGLLPGDVIVSVDDRPVQGRADLNAYLAGTDSDRPVRLGVLRRDRRLAISVSAARLPDAVVQGALEGTLGVSIAPVPSGRRHRGVRVAATRPDGALAQRGVRPGDLIVSFNGRFVDSPDHLEAAIRQAKSGHRPSAVITIRRGDHLGTDSFPI